MARQRVFAALISRTVTGPISPRRLPFCSDSLILHLRDRHGFSMFIADAPCPNPLPSPAAYPAAHAGFFILSQPHGAGRRSWGLVGMHGGMKPDGRVRGRNGGMARI